MRIGNWLLPMIITMQQYIPRHARCDELNGQRKGQQKGRRDLAASTARRHGCDRWRWFRGAGQASALGINTTGYARKHNDLTSPALRIVLAGQSVKGNTAAESHRLKIRDYLPPQHGAQQHREVKAANAGYIAMVQYATTARRSIPQ